ncbi:DUF262 domain-containing protein [Leeuwenhoekiella sp. H156]|uniref:DUF262 domain-containing protein n=1 Tax=Leeuwenhoekiella sp. H156 TaxID=3450128 RepID=UPI003FA441D4
MSNMFKTSIVSLRSLNELGFSIPTYQRPYVWGNEQLKKLLDDFYLSFKNDSDSIYYISSFLTKEEGNIAELIDGQQRFTTLWLISLILSRMCPNSDISQFLEKDEELRLDFEIRKEVREYLVLLLKDNTSFNKIKDDTYIEEQPYLKNIAAALVFIKSHIKQSIPDEKLTEFGNYIYYNVHLIKNTTPYKTDLNKLFSTINSAGVQLEQTDIVKANLLKLIDNKVRYSKIWETCENMSNFFERNARISFPDTDWKSVDLSSHISFNPEIFQFEDQEKSEDNKTKIFSVDGLDLNSLEDYKNPEKKNDNEDGRKSQEIYCRSIISFSQLLLHTYRLHLHKEGLPDFEGTFHVSRLIQIFESLEKRNNPEEIKRFFHLLWDVRYLFDKYIIKWISDVETKQEHLELVNYNKNKESNYSRSKYVKSSSLMLQSVLYFTGDYLRQYWLTTYLGYLLQNHSNESATHLGHLNYLEKIDNTFSLVTKKTDKELSWELLNLNALIEIDFNIEAYLNQSIGTSYKHYWFQKLEYILWKNWEHRENELFKNYRITSKNSIEHIYPQHPENRIQHPEIAEQDLHSFGNLVLLSVSQNSEYSNKSVRVKKSMFEEKRETYDALKSVDIFSSSQWSSFEIERHKNKMIAVILKHYRNA